VRHVVPHDRQEIDMPMPHRTFAQVAKRRLVGKEGKARIQEVRALLDELPDYRNGPYADLRKWLTSEIEETRVRSSAVHRDSISVRREGAAQIALVGPPNVGKSSILQALSEIQIKTGDYPFTTLRPVPALTRIGGVLVQLVEIPGLIAGASEDRGGGRALLGVLRSADAIVYCARPDANPAELRAVRAEVQLAGIDKPAFLAATRADEAGEGSLDRLRAAFPDLEVIPVSVIDEVSLEAFREAAWQLTGLIRIRLRTMGETDPEPLALDPGSTVADVADSVHHDLAASFIGARIWGPSARFDGQRVGRDHQVQDGDMVEILR
jgi:ribosome-interacting GTPase 1